MSSERSPTLAPGPGEMRWQHWAVRDDPWLSGLLALGALTIVAAGTVVAGSPATGIVAAALLAVASWPAWVPFEYAVTPRGVERVVLGRCRRVAWHRISGFRAGRRGVWLLVDGNRTTGSGKASLFLPCRELQSALCARLAAGIRTAKSPSSSTFVFRA